MAYLSHRGRARSAVGQPRTTHRGPLQQEQPTSHSWSFIPPLGAVPREQAESTAQLQRDMFGILRHRLDEIDGSFEANIAKPAYLVRDADLA